MLETPPFILRLRELFPLHDARSLAQSSATPPPPPPQQNGDMDQFLGEYLDVSALN